MTNLFGRRRCWPLFVALLMLVGPQDLAHAQGFVSPLLGYDYGGDSSCPSIRGCENKERSLGLSFGSIGRLFGSEFEIASAKNFFRSVPDTSSSVRTIMSSMLVAPEFGPLRPYAVIGVGRFRAKVEDVITAVERTDGHYGWNIGGGLMYFPGQHIGVRADLRYFHGFSDLELDGITLEDNKLDFGRVAAGLVIRF